MAIIQAERSSTTALRAFVFPGLGASISGEALVSNPPGYDEPLSEPISPILITSFYSRACAPT